MAKKTVKIGKTTTKAKSAKPEPEVKPVDPRKELRQFAVDNNALLSKLYGDVGVPLDNLPYTGSFDQLLSEFITESGRTLTKVQLWDMLKGLRKSGRLAKVGRSKKET